MGMILRIASSRIVGQGDIVGRSGYFSLNLSANSVMRGRLDARRTLKSLVADLRRIMKMIKRYAGILMMLTLLVGFTSCESEDETEFNLPGEWYTNEEIDFGAYTWGRGTLMTFNARNQGTIGSAGDPNYLVFEWRWIDGGYNSMELFFYGDRTYAYIWGAEATGRTFSGTWYNNWQDFRDRIDGQPFYMRRQ